MTSLRQRMTEDMQVRNLALNTQESYLQQVSQFARHFNKSPELLGSEDIRTYQLYLTNERKLATGSIQLAIAALRFLYTVTLKRDWNVKDLLPLPKKPQKLPVILSPEEVVHLLGCVQHLARELATFFGCQIRAFEYFGGVPESICPEGHGSVGFGAVEGGAPEVLGAGTPEGEIDRQWLDSSKLRGLTGWEPRVGLEDGLSRTIAWYRNHAF